MPRRALLVLALAVTGAGTAAAQSVSTVSARLFDGGVERRGAVAATPTSPWGPLARLAGPDGSLNLCDPALLATPAAPRGLFAIDDRLACRAPAGGPAAAFVALSAPGEPGGAFAGRGLRALLEDAALKNAGFRDLVRRYYERARVAPAAPKPGWAWKLALETAGGDPALAMRLTAFCGHDDATPGELRTPRSPAEARLARETESERLARRLAGRAGASPSDPLAWSAEDLAANDLAAARDRRAALDSDDHTETREGICPAPGAAYYRTDGLGAGVKADAEHRRVYAGAALACELTRGGAKPVFAANAPPNGAWVDRLIRVARESRDLATKPASDGGRLGELSPSRADAFALLAAWDPEQGFPGPKPPAAPDGWSKARYDAAVKALRAMGAEWTRGVEETAAGARFGARVCARVK
ncbi:MAG: hypothetical protein SF051_14025 [Elusimicrobiota bacterium]|nr:hypothetical protein [Elusimicrobiota bacterium]